MEGRSFVAMLFGVVKISGSKVKFPVLYKNKVIAVGKAILSSEMMKEQKIGVAVKVRDSLKNQPEG